MDERAPGNPMDDRKYDQCAYGWPVGKWQFRGQHTPSSAAAAARRGTKRTLPLPGPSGGQVVPELEDPTINYKAKQVVQRLIGGALESEEEPCHLLLFQSNAHSECKPDIWFMCPGDCEALPFA